MKKKIYSHLVVLEQCELTCVVWCPLSTGLNQFRSWKFARAGSGQNWPEERYRLLRQSESYRDNSARFRTAAGMQQTTQNIEY